MTPIPPRNSLDARLAMMYIHRMTRTQLYLDEECVRILAAESRRRGTTVSALVREAVDQAYGKDSAKDRHVLIDRLAGVWSDRADLDKAGAVDGVVVIAHGIARAVGGQEARHQLRVGADVTGIEQ